MGSPHCVRNRQRWFPSKFGIDFDPQLLALNISLSLSLLKAVESKDSAFYFTEAAPGGPEGWDRCWYDISTGIEKPAQLALLLGGEISMWSDT